MDIYLKCAQRAGGRTLKKGIFVLLTCIFICVSFSGFTQEEETDIFAKTIMLDKVYSHIEGYKVVYFTQGGFKMVSVYIPADWFFTAGGKGDLLFGEDDSYPYMDVFWINGEFSHVRLHLPSNPKHYTWGVLQEENASETFASVETIQLEF